MKKGSLICLPLACTSALLAASLQTRYGCPAQYPSDKDPTYRLRGYGCPVQSGQESRQNLSSPDQEGGGKQFTETWLVLEYCDKGNLQDAVDRGVFLMPRSSQSGSSNAADQQCNVRSVR